jgi:hypothetical protein
MCIPNRHGITQKEEAPAEKLENVGDHHPLALHRKMKGSSGRSRNYGIEHLSWYDVTTCHHPTQRIACSKMKILSTTSSFIAKSSVIEI